MALGGLGAALLVLSIPVGLIETLVASSGISESLPAAAPPLGLKARLVLAGFAALMTMGLMDMMRRTRTDAAAMDEEGRMSRPQGARQMGFAFSKLTALARGRITGTPPAPVERPTPALRRADAHPDAPARAPIFASRDFSGLDIFARPDRIERVEWKMSAEEEPVVLAPQVQELAQPTFLRASEAEPEAALSVKSEGAVLQEDGFAPQVEAEPVFLDPAPTHGLTITQLTERLERGLSLRSRAPATASARVLADMPVAAPVPVRDHVARDADDALRAALGALRTMAGRAR
ncbi:hypothetical protein [Sphingobium sp.]|uniref:hypothetical protein n=1 Tax=Sphingobium sp. TaxID=1912891 RepID=UPI003BB633E0